MHCVIVVTWHIVLIQKRNSYITPLVLFPLELHQCSALFSKTHWPGTVHNCFSTSFKYNVCTITYYSQTSIFFSSPSFQAHFCNCWYVQFPQKIAGSLALFLFACTHLNELFLLFARDGALSHFHERLLYHSEVKIHLRIEGVRVHQHSG